MTPMKFDDLNYLKNQKVQFEGALSHEEKNSIWNSIYEGLKALDAGLESAFKEDRPLTEDELQDAFEKIIEDSGIPKNYEDNVSYEFQAPLAKDQDLQHIANTIHFTAVQSQINEDSENECSVHEHEAPLSQLNDRVNPSSKGKVKPQLQESKVPMLLASSAAALGLAVASLAGAAMASGAIAAKLVAAGAFFALIVTHAPLFLAGGLGVAALAGIGYYAHKSLFTGKNDGYEPVGSEQSEQESNPVVSQP